MYVYVSYFNAALFNMYDLLHIPICSNKKDEEIDQVEQNLQASPSKRHVPPENDLLVQLLDPPMVLVIQTELCEKKTLKNWLSDHIDDRKKRTVVNFFEQVQFSINVFVAGTCGTAELCTGHNFRFWMLSVSFTNLGKG